MKLLAKIIGVLFALYCLCWVAIAVYFGFAEQHKDMLEDNLSTAFGRNVSISQLQTAWVGWSPSLRIQGLRVAGDIPEQPALAFDSASLVVSPSSLLSFWPRFTEFAVEKPVLEVVTLPNNRLQVAGIVLTKNKRPGINREKLFSWLLEQSSAAWHNGEIRWRKTDGSIQRYTDISFLYDRQQQSRSARITITAPKGTVTATANAEGDLMSSDNWDASIELVSGVGEQLLQPGDLSFDVENGIGRIRLAQLQVARIRDFLSLSGLTEKTRWILDAQLTGLLHDVEFSFNGALTNLKNWSLKASATNVGFKSLDALPALNNLSGELEANSERGRFNFMTENSTFEWSKFYAQGFPIKSAKGIFAWYRNEAGAFEVMLKDGKINDPNLSIYDLNAAVTFFRGDQKVANFGDLFKVDSIENLSYQGGDVVVANAPVSAKPTNLEATAKFNVQTISALRDYVPKVDKIKLFNKWLDQAFQAGRMSNGQASYSGELSPKAINENRAQLVLAADFDSVVLDYAPEFSWPHFTNGTGRAELKNNLLTITPKTVLFKGDSIKESVITIDNIFSRNATLNATGNVTTSLAKGLDFLLKGPLIPKAKQAKELPIEPLGGNVKVDLALSLPFTNLKKLTVDGTATIRNGEVMLPQGVPLTQVNSAVKFTERTIESDKITGQFLGGKVNAKLVTTEQSQPPKMQLQGQGTARLETLSPWIGEHVLTWFSGETDWRGSLDIDGSNLVVNVTSDLEGITVAAPQPLSKTADATSKFNLFMNLGGVTLVGKKPTQSLSIKYNDLLKADFKALPASSKNGDSSLFDRALIQLGSVAEQPLPEGINFDIRYPNLNIDELLGSVIELSQFKPAAQTQNTDFLDALRSVNIQVSQATLLGRPFSAIQANMTSRDGWSWGGGIQGDDIQGRISMQPRAKIGKYAFNLDKLVINPYQGDRPEAEPIDKTLRPEVYPEFQLTVDSFKVDGRQLGALDFVGRPDSKSWMIDKFALVHNGVRTVATGKWTNKLESGSQTVLNFDTTIDEAEGVLTDMDFEGYIRKGSGSINGNLSWAGAPDEFDYSRLNGKFDLFMKDGELVQVEPGTGKLLGLLNFNAIARRLVFDFRDVFASGLQFDRMRYRGLLANGEAIFQDAYVLTPAVFVRMEGKLDLGKELIDMDVHISPELGGNLTLLSALANPTAGAVVFITSQLFKDDMRRASFKSYQAKGTWDDFEMIEVDSEGKPYKESDNAVKNGTQGTEDNKTNSVDMVDNADRPTGS